MKPLIRNMTISTLFIACCYALLYHSLDRPLLLMVNKVTDPSIYQLCYGISLLGTPKFWLGLSLLGFGSFGLCYLSNRLGALQYRILSLSCAIFIAETIGTIFKYSLGRARPTLFLQQHFYGFQPFNLAKLYHSTPSGHTLCIFAVAYLIGLQYRRFSGLCLTIAIAVGMSRIVLAEHYLSDVLAGAYVGIIAVQLTQMLQKNIMGFEPNIAVPR